MVETPDRNDGRRKRLSAALLAPKSGTECLAIYAIVNSLCVGGIFLGLYAPPFPHGFLIMAALFSVVVPLAAIGFFWIMYRCRRIGHGRRDAMVFTVGVGIAAGLNTWLLIQFWPFLRLPRWLAELLASVM